MSGKRQRKRRSYSMDDDDSESSDSSSRQEERRRKRKKKRRRKEERKQKKRHSDDESDDSSSSSYRRRKKRRKKEKKKRKRSKEEHAPREPNSAPNDATSGLAQSTEVPALTTNIQQLMPNQAVEKLAESKAKSKSMVPMSREQYEKQQSQVREVFDAESGRWRLVKGTGEIIERICSRAQHVAINQRATQGDGDSFARSVFQAAKR